MAGPVRLNVLIGLACAMLAPVSLWSMRQELIVRDSAAGVDDAASASSSRPFFVNADAPSAAPARALLLDALRNAMLIKANPDHPDRRRMLARARYDIDRIERTRAHWGEMWIIKAFVYSLSDPGFSETERDALIHSYLDAPYLHATGRWRVQRALAHWNALPRFARERVARETIWLYLTSSGPNPAALLQAARSSDGYIPVFRELRRSMR